MQANSCRTMFKGLRVRMSVATGVCQEVKVRPASCRLGRTLILPSDKLAASPHLKCCCIGRVSRAQVPSPQVMLGLLVLQHLLMTKHAELAREMAIVWSQH